MTMERPPDSPISVLKTFIENENIKLQELNLFNVDAIPAEMKTIMIVGPQYDFSDREMQLLRDFWNKQGRILLLLDPSAKTPKLDAFLTELGVRVNDDRLMAMVRTGIEEVARVRDVIGAFSARLSDHETAGRRARAIFGWNVFAHARLAARCKPGAFSCSRWCRRRKVIGAKSITIRTIRLNYSSNKIGTTLRP